MDQNQKRAAIANFLVTKGILDPADQEAEIKKMAAQAPTAQVTEQGATTDVDKAYITMSIETGAVAPTATATSVTAATAPTPAMSTEEERNISKTLMAQNNDRQHVSASTQIEKLVFDRPDPKDVIPEGLKGEIVEKSWENIMAKITSGEYKVLPDDGEDVEADKRIASTTNYNALKAAAEAKTPVDIYRGNLSTRTIGYQVIKGSASGANAQPEYITREGLQEFVVLETNGYVQAQENKPGVMLRKVTRAADAVKGKPATVNVVMADVNKNAAKDAGAFEISRKVDTANQEDQTFKSELRFRVEYRDKFLKDGTTHRTGIIRVSVKAKAPTTPRKEELVNVFGTGIRQSNSNLIEPPTSAQADKIAEAQRLAIHQLIEKANDPSQMSKFAGIQDKISAFSGNAAAANPPA